MKALTALAAMFLSLALALPAFAAKTAVAIGVEPSRPLMDQRLRIVVTGLSPKARVTLTARSRSQDGLWWRSHATFEADAQGVVDVSRQAPASGSYGGADPMGLFWAMRPDDAPKGADHHFFAVSDFARPVETTIEVLGGGKVIAGQTIERSYLAAGAVCARVRDGVVGLLCRPNDSHVHPAVLVIGGSDGGLGEPNVAMLLASHGYSALSLAYFGEPGLPPTLEDVPMEYFAAAARLMRRLPGVDPRFVAIYGASRGTEPALYTAATSPDIIAVVARSPSFALWGGVSSVHLPGKPAWTLQGRALPHIPNTVYPDFVAAFLWDQVTRTPVRQTPLFIEDLARFGDTARVEIPVERIHGPILLLAGADDQIWPSTAMAGRIMARLRQRRHPFHDQLLVYGAVGHPIPYAYLPTSGRRGGAGVSVGGSAEGTAKAQADAWPRILAFLAQVSGDATRRAMPR